MSYRHEYKFSINYADAVLLRRRLPLIMDVDPHAVNGKYEVRSLYFDNEKNDALFEKINGVNMREKFRLRCYNGDTSFIALEKKSKINGLTQKQGVVLSLKQAQEISHGDYSCLLRENSDLCTEMYSRLTEKALKPRTVVAYTREPFIYGAGNVRVTIDSDIRTGLQCTELFGDGLFTVPAGDTEIILEVKWDGFLPDIIKAAVALDSRRATAFSKYEQCRIYG